MIKKILSTIFISNLLVVTHAQVKNDSIYTKKNKTLDEIVITGTRNETDARNLPMSVSVINQQQISNRYEQLLLPILNEQVPGLFSTSRGVMGYGISTGAAGTINLRGIGGSPTTRLLVLIDGHPQYSGLMGHPIADTYQSMLAEKVEIVRGPASVLYGSNAMGGVINIVTRKQKEDCIKNDLQVSYGSYNTLTGEFANRIRKGRLSSIIMTSYNRTDGHRENMNFEQYGGYIKLGYELSSAWTVFTDANITHFNASNPGTEAAPIIDNDSHVTRGMASISVENNYKSTSGTLSVFYNWGKHQINDGYSTGENPLSYLFYSRDQILGVTWYQSATLFTGNRLTVGVDYQHFGGDAWNQFSDNRVGLADKSENEIAGYTDFRQTIGNILTLDAGARVDHHSQTGTEFIPQIGFSIYLPHTAEIKAIVSKGFRNPTIRELYMFTPKNPNLLPERLMNYEISYSQHLMENRFSYGLNLFYITGDNMIQTIFTNGHPLNINTGKIKNWGIEANMNYRINSSWTTSANYSWLKMKYPIVATPEHKLYADVTFSQGKWDISTGVQYISGLYTSISPKNKKDFVLWNLRTSYHLSSFANLFVRGENLLAQRYEINAGYPMPKATITGGIKMNF